MRINFLIFIFFIFLVCELKDFLIFQFFFLPFLIFLRIFFSTKFITFIKFINYFLFGVKILNCVFRNSIIWNSKNSLKICQLKNLKQNLNLNISRYQFANFISISNFFFHPSKISFFPRKIKNVFKAKIFQFKLF